MEEREIVTTITKRGQVTIPAEVQRLLGVKPRDKMAFAIGQGLIRLVPARFTLESVAGSVEPATRTEDLETLITEAKEAHAARARAESSPSTTTSAMRTLPPGSAPSSSCGG